jgi:hypothetical protein
MRPINESVLLTARREFGCLNEMFIEGKRNLQDGAHVLAYRSKIWVVPDWDLDAASKRMQASIRREAQLRKSKYNKGISGPMEDRYDILHAIYSETNDRKSLEIQHGVNFQHDPLLSDLVKKVAQALGVNSITTSDRRYDAQSLKTMKAPQQAYHGTSTRWLKDILFHGISPKPGNTNFANVHHRTHIFLTTDPIKAVFHATQASQELTKHRSNYGIQQNRRNDMGHLFYQPIVLRVQIPDPALLDADFDVDRESSQTVYKDMHAKIERSKDDKALLPGDSKKISKSIGVFGYKGRILPQHITEILIGPPIDPDEPAEQEEALEYYQRFTPAQVKKALAQAEEHGLDMENINLSDFIHMPQEFIGQDEEDDDA